MKARVGFISTLSHLPWGGSEELWSRAASRMLSKGYCVEINFKKWPHINESLLKIKNDGGKIHLRDQKISFLKRFQNRIRNPFQPSEYQFNWLNDLKPDLVVITGSYGEGLDWMEACKKRSIPYFFNLQLISRQWWYQDDISGRLIEAMDRAKGLLALSNENERILGLLTGHSFKNIRRIKNPLDFPFIVPPFPIRDPTFNLASVGRYEPVQKGQDIIFEVMSDSKWKHRNLKVYCYGQGKNADLLRRMLEYYGHPAIELKGYAVLSDIWSVSHGLIMPSRMEGASLAMQEAMAYNRMVISTSVGTAEELITDGFNGFLLQCPNASDLDHAMERAWNDRFLWEEMGLRSASIISRFISEDPVDAFISLITEDLN